MTAWPKGFQRTKSIERRKGPYSAAWNTAMQDLIREVRHLKGATKLRIDKMSDNAANDWIDLTGQDASAKQGDPGVVVTFRRKGLTYIFAHDAYLKPEANLRAIGLTIEAMRAVERHNVLSTEQVFAGVENLALPARTGEGNAPHEVLGVPHDAPSDVVRAAYRQLSLKHHPDKKGGDRDTWERIHAAMEAMLS